MGTRLFSFLAGAFLLVGGILAFLSKFLWQPPISLPVPQWMWVHSGFLLGFIPENWPHNILWILLGGGAILSSVTYVTAVKYSQGLTLILTMLALIGLLPLGIADLWGILVLSSWNVGIHFVIAVLAWYFGFVYPEARGWGIATQGPARPVTPA